MISIKAKLMPSGSDGCERRVFYQLQGSDCGFGSSRCYRVDTHGCDGDATFFCFMEAVIAHLESTGKKRTAETYSAALRSFRRFREGKDMWFDALDSDMMEEYQAYLCRRGLVPNTISFHMRILRAVYNRAVERGIAEDTRPFRHVYTGVDKTVKRAIGLAALRRIRNVELKGMPVAAYARDMFMLSFFLRGMSFIDMAFLRKRDLRNGYLTYRRRKTGQQLSIRWTKEMQQIVKRYPDNETEYLLPIITIAATDARAYARRKQYQINRGLKAVAGSIGLDMPLTLYCSRHSWASVARERGVPVSVISDGLGHDNERTTQIYLAALDRSVVDKANDLIIAQL